MTPGRYAKIKALADDERADPAMRAAAQKQVGKWKEKMEGPLKGGLHPGMKQSAEYQAWVRSLNIGSKR